MTFIIAVLAFLVAIGILVGVHEFGHFWVARKLGIKIIRFAIGFGTPIWSYKSKDKDGTEYALAAIPLGGYVKMLDEREGDVAEDEKHRAFNRQPVWKRFLVVLAGPMFNFIFAIAAFATIQMMGIDSVRPYIGEIEAGSPASYSGFEAKDRVLAINGVPVESMRQVRLTLLNEYLKNPELAIHVETQEGKKVTRVLDLSCKQSKEETTNLVAKLAKYGVAKEDGTKLLKKLDTCVPLLSEEGDYFARTGIDFWRPPHQTIIVKVMPDSAAQAAGLEAEDIIIGVDGQKLNASEEFSKIVQAHAGKPIALMINRKGADKSITLTPRLTTDDKGVKRSMIGVGLARKYNDADMKDLFFIRQAPFFEAFKNGMVETWDMSVMTLKVMGRLVTGEASLKNISGPLTIANYAGKSASVGFSAFLTLLAIVSLSLGVLNLLPIPMLDGGHLLYYMIELVKGSPVSERVEAIGMRIGMSLVGVLMVVALYNDIGRLIQ